MTWVESAGASPSTYEIFKPDVRPRGFRVTGFDEFIRDYTLGRALAVVQDPDTGAEIAERNYNLGCRCHSFHALEWNLMTLLGEKTGMDAGPWDASAVGRMGDA